VVVTGRTAPRQAEHGQRPRSPGSTSSRARCVRRDRRVALMSTAERAGRERNEPDQAQIGPGHVSALAAQAGEAREAHLRHGIGDGEVRHLAEAVRGRVRAPGTPLPRKRATSGVVGVGRCPPERVCARGTPCRCARSGVPSRRPSGGRRRTPRRPRRSTPGKRCPPSGFPTTRLHTPAPATARPIDHGKGGHSLHDLSREPGLRPKVISLLFLPSRKGKEGGGTWE